MDDYEVDLIDYLRVIWWGKWIIIACFVVAVGVSAAIMWTRPNEYAVTVQYRYNEQLSQLTSPRQFDAGDQASAMSNEQSRALSLAVEATPLPTADGKLKKTVSITGGSGKVTLSGGTSPSELVKLAQDFSSLLKKGLNQQMEESVQLAIDSAGLRVTQLEKERDMLKERIAAALTTNDPVADYLAAKVADLEGTIVQNQALAETLQATDPTTLFQLSASQQEPALMGPNRKMSIAVAGVLGLFVGVLLAFFVHYLISAGKREATHKKA